MKIAIYGGSFDPPHLGHISIARQVTERFAVDSFIFMPAYHSPLKDGRPSATDADRLAMLRIATEGEHKFEVSDFELSRGGVSYTVDTLREWRKRYPEAELFFIVGMDSLLTLHRWKEPLEIVRMCRFITFRRPLYDMPKVDEIGLPRQVAENLLSNVIDGELVDVSSSEIRNRLAAGKSISGLVSQSVDRYIHEHSLYAA